MKHRGIEFEPEIIFTKHPSGATMVRSTIGEHVKRINDELLAPRKKTSTGRPKKQTEAENWLESFLSDGPVNSKLVEAEGKEQGYSKSTLERVKKTMGILSIPIRNKSNMKIIKWEWIIK